MAEQPKRAKIGSPCEFAKNFTTFGGGIFSVHHVYETDLPS